VFLDIGAHAGAWALPVSRTLRDGHVYAFEAFPYYARLLKNVVILMRRPNVTVVVGAVADRPGQTSIVWKDAKGRRLTGKTHMSATTAAAGLSVTVPTLTIDGYYTPLSSRRVRLMKCDVEGAELLALRGAERTIATWRPIVFCEINAELCTRYGYGMEDVFEFFAARSYASFTVDGGLRRLNRADYSGLGDVVFVPCEVETPTTCA
jgi:FkbM family methyltransferase